MPTLQAEELAASREQVSERTRIWRRFVRYRPGLVGLAVIGLLFIFAIFAPLIAPHAPEAIDTSLRGDGPSATYPLGNDDVVDPQATSLADASAMPATQPVDDMRGDTHDADTAASSHSGVSVETDTSHVTAAAYPETGEDRTEQARPSTTPEPRPRRSNDENSVWVGSVSKAVTNEDLLNLFSAVGEVTDVWNSNQGWATITYVVRALHVR